jgi:DNA-binding response OmpR family regulator
LIEKLHATSKVLPVIMVTGTLPQEEFTRNPKLQPAATLLKPYTIAELLETVKKVLRAIGGAREKRQPPPSWQGLSSTEG